MFYWLLWFSPNSFTSTSIENINDYFLDLVTTLLVAEVKFQKSYENARENVLMKECKVYSDKLSDHGFMYKNMIEDQFIIPAKFLWILFSDC
jgi:hypothetical protein